MKQEKNVDWTHGTLGQSRPRVWIWFLRVGSNHIHNHSSLPSVQKCRNRAITEHWDAPATNFQQSALPDCSLATSFLWNPGGGEYLKEYQERDSSFNSVKAFVWERVMANKYTQNVLSNQAAGFTSLLWMWIQVFFFTSVLNAASLSIVFLPPFLFSFYFVPTYFFLTILFLLFFRLSFLLFPVLTSLCSFLPIILFLSFFFSSSLLFCSFLSSLLLSVIFFFTIFTSFFTIHSFCSFHPCFYPFYSK